MAATRLGILLLCATAWSAAAERLPRDQARKLDNPLDASPEVLRQGRRTYLRLCQYCHGPKGKAQANPDFEAPSLLEPDTWRFGSSDGETFVSIRDGAGHAMPAFGSKASEEQIWQLVHYVRSLQPEKARDTGSER